MTQSQWERMESLFHDALALPLDQQTQFLSEACGEDEDLRRQLERMLEAHKEDRRLRLEERLLSADDSGLDADDSMVGREIGAYRLERLIGKGGMGDVYLAARSDEQYEHSVALKLIRPGLQAGEATARFLQERQILAQLEHPNIATLLDGGVTDDGRPYLVMQYVDGRPITDYCQQHQLGVRERLELFRTVCEAVHVAHVNLVVHRDIKPANILVTEDGQVKLLDFGIAKLLDPTVPLTTRPLDRVMTPEHAAPEQVAGDPITTAADVYALGVLLYQLLTGRRPIEFDTSSPSDIERAIREVEPEPPSSVSDLHARDLGGELDNIVLMALRKEPGRRYQSALELSDDVGRFLNGLPVRAQRDTLWYRSRKFLARNRVGVAVIGVIAALIVGFAVVAVTQSHRIAGERDRAEAERQKAERIVAVLTDLLGQVNPYETPGGDTLRVADFIDRIEVKITDLDDQPAVQARMWELLANIHRARSGYDKAFAFYDNALRYYEGDPELELDAVRVRHDKALVVLTTEGAAAAEPLLRESLQRTRELRGDSHPDVAIAMQVLAGAIVYSQPDEAMALVEEAMEILRANSMKGTVNAAALSNQLGIYYLNQSDFDRAEENFENSLDILRQHVGDDHPNVLAVSHNLAMTLGRRGDWERAEGIFRATLETRQRVLGPGAVETGRSWEGLGSSLAHQGRLDEALEAFQNSLRIFHEAVGTYNEHTSNAANNVGSVFSLQGRPEAALTYLDSSIAIDRRLAGGDNLSVATKRCRRTFQLFMMGERESAVALAREALAVVDSLAPDESDEHRVEARGPLAVMLLATGDTAEAENMMRFIVEQREAKLPESNPYVVSARCMLGVVLALQGRTSEAQDLLRDNYALTASWGLLPSLHRSLLEEAMQATGLSAH